MLSSPCNRAVLGVDNPVDSDGFYMHRRFKAKDSSGKSGKKPWRRVLRAKEKRAWARELLS